jgi:8-oxo-dGTP pyrophosphatase MutT (NUDIX family)
MELIPSDKNIENKNIENKNIENKSVENKTIDIPHEIKSSYSAGIACCKITTDDYHDIKLRILVVRRRNTYAFLDFMYSRYVKFRFNPNMPKKTFNDNLIDLFNKMTVHEKFVIMSLDFDKIWYQAWLCAPPSQSEIASVELKDTNNILDNVQNILNNSNDILNYIKFKNKFKTTFLDHDGGASLKKLIKNSNINAQPIWEIPKGRLKTKIESQVNCAVREFYEETNIPKSLYKVLPNTAEYEYIDNNVKYKFVYFLAVTKFNIEPKIIINSNAQFSEIDEVKWVDLVELKLLNEKLSIFVRDKIFAVIKKKINNDLL